MFSPKTWIDYVEVFAMGVFFRKRIMDIPKQHIVSRFNLVSSNKVKILNQYYEST